jgi:hypothetical protein
MAICTYFDLKTAQLDIIIAFFYTNCKGRKPIFCDLLDRFKEPRIYAELKRALYELRDLPLLWYKKFSATL